MFDGTTRPGAYGANELYLKIPRPANQSRPHSAARLQRWVIFILLSSPGIDVGSSLCRIQAPDFVILCQFYRPMFGR